MEADWEIEVGGDAPVIDAHWAGLVDLRRAPERACSLAETKQLAGLAEALMRLNAQASPVWTSKCDVWMHLEQEEFDVDELDAPEEAAHGAACYIDLLPSGDLRWTEAAEAGEWCKWVCSRLRTMRLRSCRVDLVVRSAMLSASEAEAPDHGVTAYITAAGRDEAAASKTLSAAVAVFADSIAPAETSANAASKLQ